VVALSPSQYSMFLLILLPLYLGVRAHALLRDRALLAALALSVVVGAAISAPYVAARLDAGTVVRSLWENRQYVVAHPLELVDPDAYAHIGAIPLVLAGVGMWPSSSGTRRSHVLGFSAIAIFSIAMMFGPKSSLYPYTWFYDVFPLFDRMRTPIRFVLPAQLAIFVLGGFGVARLSGRRWLPFLVILGVIVIPLLSTRYFHRGQGPGAIWAFEIPLRSDD
jgi:hypothetical protein